MSGGLESIQAVYPWVDFRITTGDGEDFEVEASEVTLEGEAWVSVRGIALAGEPLDVTWLDGQTWQVVVPLDLGPNTITLEGTDLRGEVVGTDAIVVTASGG